MPGAVLKHLDEKSRETGPATAKKAKSKHAHWKLSRDVDNVAWLVLDKKDASANTLSEAVLTELDDIIQSFEDDPPAGVVLRSAKKSGFIAGADINEIQKWQQDGAIADKLRDGHNVVDRLERLRCPTIAVVHGYCLGGGFELALACDYRIAIDGAFFGLPEVLLGLHPGLGGTARLTRLIDPVEAMTMMLTGKNAYTKKARKLGIANAVTEERHVEAAVRDAIAGKMKKPSRDLKDMAVQTTPGRALAAKMMESKTAEKADREHYPAPYAIIDLWRDYGDDAERMKVEEIKSFENLLTTDTAKNLIRVFFLRENLKKLGEGKHDIEHIHVIGAGAMGGDIAAWCALKGYTVSVSDMKAEPLAKAVKDCAKLCDDKHLDREEKRDVLDRFIPDLDQHGLKQADLVIEAVPEVLDIKHSVYKAAEKLMKKDAILATNTSSIPLEDLGKGLKKPSRLVGLHFFNPVSKMDVVEVVAYKKTAKTVLDAAKAFTGAIDKLCTPVNSAPGFLVNRALTPYLLEAMVMVDEGVKPEDIDAAAEAFGMPMGPIEVADQVGLDICLHVAEMLKSSLDKPMPEIPGWLKDKIDKGDLGRKTCKGFYTWKDGKAKKPETAGGRDDDMRDRLILPLLDACVECLRTEVVADEDTLDGAMIFATGFAPFRGGPMHYARSRGLKEVVDRLKDLEKYHGERFTPDEGWQALIDGDD